MKKFNSGDIIYNTIRAYPKVRFFANSGSVNSDSIFDFLPEPITVSEPILDCVILAENGNLLIGQNGNFLTKEQCEDLIFLLAEDGQVLLEETGTGLTPE